jgi:hypothetical protein
LAAESGVFGLAFCKEGETAEPSRFFAGDSRVAREERCAAGAPDAVKRWVVHIDRYYREIGAKVKDFELNPEE